MRFLRRFYPDLLFVGGFVLLCWFGMGVQAWWQGGYSRLPSSYDAKQPLMQVASTHSTPVLVEFYSDSCQGCQQLTPVLHRFSQQAGFKDCFAFAMVNVDDAENGLYTELFRVESVPAVFVFDMAHMKKTPLLPPDANVVPTTRSAWRQVFQAGIKHHEAATQASLDARCSGLR